MQVGPRAREMAKVEQSSQPIKEKGTMQAYQIGLNTGDKVHEKKEVKRKSSRNRLWSITRMRHTIKLMEGGQRWYKGVLCQCH